MTGQTQVNYRYNGLNQLDCTTTGSDCSFGLLTDYAYDIRGNLASTIDGADITLYDFDAMDRLTGVTLPDTTQIDYTYDWQGHRVQQVNGGQVTNYLWDAYSPYGDVILETNASDVVQAEYVLGGTDLISQTRGGQNDYYLTDALGSVRLMTDGAGAVTNTYRYDAFGNLVAQTGSRANSYLYTGQQFDAATGLYSLRARYYDPGMGRFLSYDKAPYQASSSACTASGTCSSCGAAGTESCCSGTRRCSSCCGASDQATRNVNELNCYAYVANNPIRFLDPTGFTLAEDIAGSIQRIPVVPTAALIGVGVLSALRTLVEELEDVDVYPWPDPENAKKTCKIRCKFIGAPSCSTIFTITYSVNNCNQCPRTSTNAECNADARGQSAIAGGCQGKHHNATCS